MSLPKPPEHVREAICDGYGLIFWISGLRFAGPLGLQPVHSFFETPQFVDEEKNFLNAILNILYLFFSCNGIIFLCQVVDVIAAVLFSVSMKHVRGLLS